MNSTTIPQSATTTREFELEDMLSITTGRLVSSRHMEAIYDILNHVTGDNLFTHQLPRACEFAAPLLLRDFPELAPANVCTDKLDEWIAADETERKTECGKMWLAELKMMFPAMDKTFVVRSYSDEWTSRHPIQELVDMGCKNIIATDCSPESMAVMVEELKG